MIVIIMFYVMIDGKKCVNGSSHTPIRHPFVHSLNDNTCICEIMSTPHPLTFVACDI